MRLCPNCWENFEDDLSYCMFDGTALQRSDQSADSMPTATPEKAYHIYPYIETTRGKRRKGLMFVLMIVVLIGSAVTVYLSRKPEMRPSTISDEPPSVIEPVKAAEPEVTEAPALEKTVFPNLLAEITRNRLMEILPGDSLRRFRSASPDLRIVSDDKNEYIVLAGIGSAKGAPVGRIQALHYKDGQFLDATRQLLPNAYGSGAVKRRGEVKFDEANVNILVREPASSGAIVDECDACDHAYQQVTLSWKNGRYVESSRAWDNDRYTVFYAVADALEKRQIDARARPVIDRSLDAKIARGFARNDKKGWTVIWRNSGAEAGEYELNNGADYLVITVSKDKGTWKAIAITGG